MTRQRAAGKQSATPSHLRPGRMKPAEYAALSDQQKRERTKHLSALASRAHYNAHIEDERQRNKIKGHHHRIAKCVREQRLRAERFGCSATLTADQAAWLYDYYGHRCAYCGAEAHGRPLTLDHFVPLSPGYTGEPGTHALGNMVLACEHCNYSKRNGDPVAFLHGKWGTLFDRQLRTSGVAPFYEQLYRQAQAWAEHQPRWGELGPPVCMDEAEAA